MKGFIRQLFRLGTFSLLAAASTQVFAAGYKMEFQSASVLADAGDAAVVEDAGTNWFNSAGLIMLPQQLVGSVIDLYDRTQFTGSVNAPNVVSTALGPNFFAQGSSNSNLNHILPAIHYSLPIRDRFAIGLSIVPAWGLAEDFGTSSFVRYELTRIYTKTIDIAPSIAVKINDKWSVGAGPDFNYLALDSKFNINSQSTAIGSVGDSVSRISGDDWNTGWHAGVLWRANDCTRFGINYRSKIVMHLTGYSGLFGLPAAVLATPSTNAFTFNWVLPPTTTISAYRDLNSRWAIMGSIAYDEWSTLRDYNAQNYMTATGPAPVTLYQGHRDTFDLGFGAHYTLNDKWMFRANAKYEPTPTGDLHRDINFPDSDKLGVQIGGRYHFSKKLAMDLIYGHVFTKAAPIRPQQVVNARTQVPLTGVTINGHTNTEIDLIGAQLIWNI